MPKLNFKAVPLELVREASGRILDDMEALLACPRESLSIEVTNSAYVRDGVLADAMPVVEVEWLARPKELQDAAAALIASHLSQMGLDRADIVFTILDPDRFYRIRP